MRRSGQTFRMVAQAIVAASANGNCKILLGFGNVPSADYAYRMGQAMTLPIRDFATASPSHRQITFANGSRIDFRAIDSVERSKGLRYHSLRLDGSMKDIVIPDWWDSAIASIIDKYAES